MVTSQWYAEWHKNPLHGFYHWCLFVSATALIGALYFAAVIARG